MKNVISYLMFGWLNSLFSRGYKRGLKEDDLPALQKRGKSQNLCTMLERNWNVELAEAQLYGNRPSLIKATCKTFGRHYLLLGTLILLKEAIVVGTPILLLGFLRFFENEATLSEAYLYAFGLTITSIIMGFLHEWYFYKVAIMGWHLRAAMCALMYKKVPLFMNHFWISPLILVGVVVLVWQLIGISSLVILVPTVFAMLLSIGFGRFYGKVRMKTSLRTDKRVRMMNEILSAMRVVKMFTWEKPYQKLIDTMRRKEIRQILNSAYFRGFSLAMTYITNRLAMFGTFVIYVALGGEFTSSKVFAVIALINVLRMPVGTVFPWAVDYTSEGVVSLRRIEEDEQRSVTLKDINIQINNNMLLAVIGPVGSGKSSFLSSIMRELPPKMGRVSVQGKVAYAGQIPWVFSGTIKENILFGEKCDYDRINKVIDVCAMREDIESFDNGVDTLVGERGVTLSGGQKARVNLARAAYRENTDIILMDDPLSAVDSNVANQLFHQCICGHMKNKLRVLVTHQLSMLKTADMILVLKEGEICSSGTFNELLVDGTDFASLLKHDEDDEDKSTNACGVSKRDCEEMLTKTYDINENQTKKNLTVGKETKEDGNISWKAFYEYMVNNKASFFLIVFLTLINQTLFVLFDWWFSVWSTASENFHSNVDNFSIMTNSDNTTSALPVATTSVMTFNNTYYIHISTYLLLGYVVTMFLRFMLQMRHLVMSGLQMHNKMLNSILMSPIRFFDVNPIGRVLNRFSKDLGQVDEILPRFCMEFSLHFGILFSVVILSSVVNYFVLIPTIPLILYFLWLRRYYVTTSRDIKRIEGMNRSPVFSHMKSTLDGLTTVRAFGMQKEFEAVFHRLQDRHSLAWSAFLGGTRWFSTRLDLIGGVYFGAVSFLAVITASQTNLNAGEVGLTVTYVMLMFGRLQWCVRTSTEIETLMTSVERIRQYYKLPSEAQDHNPGNNKKIPLNWPLQGEIQFTNVNFAHYSGGPDVLHDISLKISSHEKIGIVGRTGAGKSSVIACLFRFNELSSGKISIDGVDVSELTLTTLRSSISAIPQDPILFAGSLRYNLDPFSDYTDPDLWNALEKVEMKKVINSYPKKLEMELSESGSNFSVGQRQLLCLARAILKKNKILVVDEATANVDVRTDQAIQKTTRETFKNCTVITVAHRINTIIDCDRVLVLNDGKVMEFDEPHKLLQSDGMFSGMVEAIGVSESRSLRKSAEEAFIGRRPQ